MAVRERLVVDDDDVFGRLTVEREPAPLLQLMPLFVPVGAGRAVYDEAEANARVEVEYIAPGRAA